MEISQPAQPQKQASTSWASQHSAPEFTFVNVTHPDEIGNRNTQSKIHRHVMKDIGLARRRRPRKQHIFFKPTSEKTTSSNLEFDKTVLPWQSDGPVRYASNLHSQRNPRFALSQLFQSGFSLPHADPSFYSRIVSSRAQRLLSFLYREDSPMCQTLRSLLFFTLAMADESVMYLALADSALYTGQQSQKSRRQENAYALQHYTTSVGVFNEQLRNATSAVGDAIIGTAVGLASYDLRIHNFTRWAIHMDGLQRMIQSRGGIDMIGSPYLRKILIWSDLVGSLSLDLPPRFAASVSTVIPVQEHTASAILARTISALQGRSPSLSDICPLLKSLGGLAELAAGELPTHWNDNTNLTQTLSLVVHEMLSLPRHEIPEEQNNPSIAGLAMREAIRLVSLLFLTAPVNYLAGNRDDNTIHRGRLPNLLRSHALDWSGLEELELWVLVIDALIEIDEDRAWIIRRIKRIMQMSGLDWQGVLHVLWQIAWTDGFSSDEVDRLGAEFDQMHSIPFDVL